MEEQFTDAPDQKALDGAAKLASLKIHAQPFENKGKELPENQPVMPEQVVVLGPENPNRPGCERAF